MGYRHHVKFDVERRKRRTYREGVPSRADVRHVEVIELLGDAINDGEIC